jgi:hypothetical protein
MTEDENRKIKAERDMLLNFLNSLDERLLVNRINGERRRHHEILYFVKSQIFDTQQSLKYIGNGNYPVSD